MRSWCGGVLCVALVGAGCAIGTASHAVAATTPDVVYPNLVKVWDTGSLPDVAGSPIALSSPVVGDLDGQPDVVVGSRSGNLYAFHLSNGTTVGGWPVSLGTGQPIDSPPSVDGSTVFVGTGDANVPQGGAYLSFAGNGARRWTDTVGYTPGSTTTAGVISGLALGDLQGVLSAVSGSLSEQEDEINAASGGVNPGFPWYEADSNFTTPAIADLYGNGVNEIIEGGDSTAGSSYNVSYPQGGHLRVLSQTGNAGTGTPGGGLICDYDTQQVVQSSPAVGTFLGGGAVGITFGTGYHYPNAPQTDDLLATNSHCQVQWTAALDGYTNDSPALVDAEGNGALQIAEGTQIGATGGTVYLLNGSNGATIWSTPALGAVIGSITSADLGGGYQDLLVPTTGGLQIIDGRSGMQVAAITGIALQSSPLVTEDANGQIGITIAGYNGSNVGEVAHYTVSGTNGALADEVGAWPEFHHDPHLSGDAGTPPPVVEVPCSPPTSPHGYDLFASDGGVFNYGDASFCGSTGNLQLTAPVTGGTTTKDLGGYWEVATDGGVFAFGDAPFLGAASSAHPAASIVGIAATPDDRGYWEVGADGGIFAYGDATFYGSAQPFHPVKPIVGIAATADGKGYWLVASDGGVFAFGDARFFGSAGNLTLARPVVGMAPDEATGGYWLVASDGGVFAYGAPFYGSEGGTALARPMVGIDDYAGGLGYRTVASDGGVFAFHASFYGSAGGLTLTRPVVGMSGQGT